MWIARRNGIVLAVGAALGIVLLSQGRVSYGQRIPVGGYDCNVAVVDVDRVRREYKKTEKLLDEITADAEKVKADLKSRKDAIDGLNYELSQLEVDSQTFRDKQKELLEKTVDFEVTKKFNEVDLISRDFVAVRGVVKDIYEQAKIVAEEKGIDLVLYKDDIELGDDDARDRELFWAKVRGRKVIYVVDRLDITNDVISGLNQGFKLGQF